MEYSEASRDLSACLQVGFRYSNGCVLRTLSMARSLTPARLNGYCGGVRLLASTLSFDCQAGREDCIANYLRKWRLERLNNGGG